MISVSNTIEVNPEGTEVELTRADVWRGLEAKANDALPFVPQMTFCEVSESGENYLVREVEYRGDRFGERVTLNPQESVHFERTHGSVMGDIRNEILDGEDGLELRFSFDLELQNAEAGSTEEKEYEETMREGYMQAVVATLAAIRRWVSEERAPAAS